MKTANKLLIGSVSRTALTIFNMAIAFFMMPFLIEHLGDQWYGIWTVLGSVVGYYYLVDFGITSAVQRYVAKYIAVKDEENANATINTALIIFSLLGFFLLIVTALLSYFIEYIIKNPAELHLIKLVIIILGANLALEFPFKSFTGIIGAYVRYDLISYSRFFIVVLTNGLIFYFISQGYGILALAAISFGCTQLSNIFFFLISKYLFKNMRLGTKYFRKTELRNLFGYSVWSFLVSISEQMRFRIDSLVIAGFLGPVFVTHYFIGARLADYFRETMFRATDLFTPIFTKYHATNNYDELKSKLQFVTKINSILAFFLGGIIIIVGKPFIYRWMGEKYMDAYPILVILTFAMIFEIVLNPAKSILYATAKHRYYALINTSEGIVNLGLSLTLIKFWGINGVALGTLIPLVVFKIVLIPNFTCKLIGLPIREYLGNLAAPILFTVLYLVGHAWLVASFLTNYTYLNIAIAGALSVPLYAIAILFLSFNGEERNFFKKMLLNWT